MNPIPPPRPEYPRPRMVREDWVNLNGTWQFEIDQGKSGRARDLHFNNLSGRIVVPFCPESKLSGIGHKDFMNAVWYRREFEIPAAWKGRRILLHFGAVDYEAEVWINGLPAGRHRGGYTPFSLEITGLIKPGMNILTVCAEDDNRSGLQPCGKQSTQYPSQGCCYTRTTGIWQTVWLEAVGETFAASFKIIPDPANRHFYIETALDGPLGNLALSIKAYFKGKPVGEYAGAVSGRRTASILQLSETHLWFPGSPNLYDLEFILKRNGEVIDKTTGYAGLRSITWDGKAVSINGKPVFQRLVLDQGYYPDGIYTAPSDEALKNDILLAMGMGFNGARLHEKIFEPRYLYWADKLGFMAWGEYANWGLNITGPMGLERFLPEWLEALQRDCGHPCVIGWCPFNETWDDRATGAKQDDEVLRLIYQVTKALDPTRPVIDTSGAFHVATDIFDVHDYEQDPEVFAERYGKLASGEEIFTWMPHRQKYEGQPYMVSEYGGIWWNPGQKDEKSWGYGNRPQSEAEFLKRYEGLTRVLLANPKICGFCYTQLYDVEQEVNGLYTYDRKPKFDPAVIRAINQSKAAMEK
ncbi:MAG: glycoside hydrolase family 2 protein [Bacillota bacterium]